MTCPSGRTVEERTWWEVDAIIVFMGTNDFNAGVPIGEWFTETEEQVMAARGETKKMEHARNAPL